MKLKSRELRKIIKEEQQRVLFDQKSGQLIRESILILEAQGCPDDEILDTLLSEGWWQNIYDGSVEAVKTKLSALVVDIVLGAFDVDVNTTAGGMARNLAIQMGENFEWSKWRDYLSEGSCPLWVELVNQSILEAFVIEPIFDSAMEAAGFIRAGGKSKVYQAGSDFGGPDAGLGEILFGLLRNSVKEATSEALTGPISDTLGNILCEIRVPDVLSPFVGRKPAYKGVRSKIAAMQGLDPSAPQADSAAP